MGGVQCSADDAGTTKKEERHREVREKELYDSFDAAATTTKASFILRKKQI